MKSRLFYLYRALKRRLRRRLLRRRGLTPRLTLRRTFRGRCTNQRTLTHLDFQFLPSAFQKLSWRLPTCQLGRRRWCNCWKLQSLDTPRRFSRAFRRVNSTLLSRRELWRTRRLKNRRCTRLVLNQRRFAPRHIRTNEPRRANRWRYLSVRTRGLSGYKWPSLVEYLLLSSRQRRQKRRIPCPREWRNRLMRQT